MFVLLHLWKCLVINLTATWIFEHPKSILIKFTNRRDSEQNFFIWLKFLHSEKLPTPCVPLKQQNTCVSILVRTLIHIMQSPSPNTDNILSSDFLKPRYTSKIQYQSVLTFQRCLHSSSSIHPSIHLVRCWNHLNWLRLSEILTVSLRLSPAILLKKLLSPACIRTLILSVPTKMTIVEGWNMNRKLCLRAQLSPHTDPVQRLHYGSISCSM